VTVLVVAVQVTHRLLVLGATEAFLEVAVEAVALDTVLTQVLVAMVAMATFVSLHSSKEPRCQDNSY
jgi:hypothetical protein